MEQTHGYGTNTSELKIHVQANDQLQDLPHYNEACTNTTRTTKECTVSCSGTYSDKGN
jgi:hypothetical protein